MRRLLYAFFPLLLEKSLPTTLMGGLALTPLVAFFEALIAPSVKKYLFADWEFAGFLLVLVLVDTTFGLLRAWHLHLVNSRAFSRLFLKVMIYMGLLVLAHVLTSFTVDGKPNLIFQWFDWFIYSAMMAREGLSILEHMADIAPDLVPTWLLKRLKQYTQEGPLPGAPTPLYAAPAPLAEVVPIPTSPLNEEMLA